MLLFLVKVEARFGEQSNRMAVRHEDLNRLLSTLYSSSMQLLITENRVASARVTQHLQSGRVRQQQLQSISMCILPVI